LGIHGETSGLHGAGFAEDPDADRRLQHIDDPHQDDNLAKLPADDHGPSAAGPVVQGDALKDRFAGGQAGHALSDQGVHEGREALHDNLQGVAQDSLKKNLQGVGQDALHDNLQGVGQDALHDNLQGVANEALSDNKAGMGKDAITDNKAGIGKYHLSDHLVVLPDTGGLTSGPSGKASDSAHAAPDNGHPNATASSPHKKKPSVAAPVKKSAEDLAHEAEALLQAKIEKEKRLEEFHGRVDAIRKTVSGINHKLDELDEEEQPKP
jgi:hypothetical protein